MEILAAIGIALALLTIFVVSYLLNKKIPKPEGCDEDIECLECKNSFCRFNKKSDEDAVNQNKEEK